MALATLFKLHARRSDWVARWNEHLFAIGFCDNTQIHETAARIHQVLEECPFDVVPGEERSPIVACGVCEHSPGMDLQKFYEMARDAMSGAENGVKSSDAANRLVIIIPESPIDPELKAMLEK